MNKRIIIPGAEPFYHKGSSIGCLLVHGFTSSPTEMRLLGEFLSSYGYSVLGVRLFAHATSPEDMLRARWHDWLASVEDGWHLLTGACQRIYVIGISLGGVLALLIAAKFPVSGVIAIATPHHMPPDPRVRWLKIHSLIKPFIPKGPPQWYDDESFRSHIRYLVNPTRAYIEIRELLPQLRISLPEVTAPTLLIYSKQDQTVKAKDNHMEEIYQALGSQKKESIWIENSGHIITRDQERHKVFLAIFEFIERVEQTS